MKDARKIAEERREKQRKENAIKRIETLLGRIEDIKRDYESNLKMYEDQITEAENEYKTNE